MLQFLEDFRKRPRIRFADGQDFRPGGVLDGVAAELLLIIEDYQVTHNERVSGREIPSQNDAQAVHKLSLVEHAGYTVSGENLIDQSVVDIWPEIADRLEFGINPGVGLGAAQMTHHSATGMESFSLLASSWK